MSYDDKNKFASLAVNRPVTISMILFAILVIGWISFKGIPIEMMPTGFNPPFLGVWVPYPNANPSEIEEQVAKPVEEQIRTIPGVSEVSSHSSGNGCWIWVEFHNGTNMDFAYDQLRDRIERARATLPNDIDRIYLRKYGPDNSSIMDVAIAFYQQYQDPYYLVEHYIKAPLERINGVASVDIYGADEKMIQIEINQNKAKAYNINLFETIDRLRRDNFTLSSGWVTEGGKKFSVRSIGKFKNIEEIRNIPIGSHGIKLKDIAQISFKAPETTWHQRLNGVKSVKLEIMKESLANTVEISAQVEETLAKLSQDPNLEGLEFKIFNSQGNEIRGAINNLIYSAIWGGIFAILILFFFLRKVRMTLIVTFSIPISITVALTLIYFMGWTLNVITMMGLMISVGMVIDNSIVVLENIFRHQQNGMETKKSAVSGTAEVALAITLATFTTIVVFLPLFIMKDDVGYFKFYLRRIGTPVIFSLLSSLLVALVLIPLATTKFPLGEKMKESRIITRGNILYKNLLKKVLHHRFDTALFMAFILGFTFLYLSPKIERTDSGGQSQFRIRFIIDIPPNVSIQDINDYISQVEDTVLAYKDKYNIHFIDVGFRKNRAMLFLYLNRTKDRQWFEVIWDKILSWKEDKNEVIKDPDRIISDMKKLIPVNPGYKVRTSWVNNNTGSGTVSIVLYGDDTGKLIELSDEVERRLNTLPEIISTETSLETGNDELQIKIDREAARKNGINPNQMAYSLMYAVRGIELSRFHSGEKEIRMKIQLREQDRQNLTQLANMTFRNQGGRAIPLSALADISVAKGFGQIRRLNGKTNIEVKATTAKENLQHLSSQIDNVMKNFKMPYGYSWSKGKRFNRWRQSGHNFGTSIFVAIFFVFILMGILFESFILPLSVMISIPLSFFGAFLGLYITGNAIDTMASIGFIILVGIVVNNAIVLIDLTNKYRNSGMSRESAILAAGTHRFRPILMTAFTTIAGIIPLALGDASAAGISYKPMGVVIIGGMLISTFLTLVAVPLLYTFMDDIRINFLNLYANLRSN